MGFFSKLFGGLVSNKPVRVLCVGLDNSGKSTIIHKLKPKKAALQEVVPTVGFQVEQFAKHNVHFTVFDMSGQGRYRGLWEHYYKDVQGIIYVIDCADKIRMCVAKDELETLLNNPDIAKAKVPILFFANKMDIPSSLDAPTCVKLLELDKIMDKPWHIVQTNALTGEGLEEGLNWLSEKLKH
mmetsp:Transcript_28800/g.46606  ORF Transcript_28800/g.46606 Transcript_28800/m.46606 type:complete len:183 (+) Transcript_28800:170-718(+)|eukprot:CAMPEP_0184643626 /NCGR_PEP_ID=MMETSP0308-20130426/457_1 /TAXON_ID=38269 /ORGANISM="Gloeochaete witrockiana, Strain SAG 46.84" /LENGTH=182 /DNA_ID=CAMNT_0027071679 /DNA_START=170 /DNA_END=718 /DNA_ORIENTATION=-